MNNSQFVPIKAEQIINKEIFLNELRARLISRKRFRIRTTIINQKQDQNVRCATTSISGKSFNNR